MKNYLFQKAIAFSIIVLVWISCSKPLNINPVNSVDQTLAFNTSGDVLGALVGAYTRAGAARSYGGDILLEPELLGDDGDISYTDSFIELSGLITKKITISNGFVAGTWEANYSTINTVNNVLAAISKVDKENQARAQGEAKFLRGLSYFDLVRLFGRAYNDGDPTTNLGVPLVLKPTSAISDSNYVARNTVSQVYAQVIKDLTDAMNLLPAAKSNGYFADRACAQAVLARVYLTTQNYTMAASMADSVIESGAYSLTKTYAQEFPNPNPAARQANSTEDIFSIQVSAQAGVNELNTWYASSTYAGRGKTTINDQHLAKYDANDDRLNLFYVDGGSTYTGKFNNQYGNVICIRLAEMYLIRAEANFLNGSAIGDSPVNDVNQTRTRALLSPLTTVALSDIRAEKYKELCFEGQTLFDKKRYKQSVLSLNYNDPSLVYPIPLRELEANAKLVQNPGY